MEEIQKRWKRWPYKNTLLLILSLILLYYFSRTPAMETLIRQADELGYVGAFVTGIFFVSTFTVAPAAVVLYHLAENLHPLEVALLAGLGAMLGDYILFRFIRDGLAEELAPVFRRLGHPSLKVLFRSPYFAWLLPLAGAFIIASPLPDEAGVSMLGASKIKQWQFFLLAFVLNAAGILGVVLLARSL